MAINAGYINVGKDRLSSGLSATFNLCYKINSSADKEVEIDLSNTKFVTPSFIVPLTIFTAKCGRKVKFINAGSYLSGLYFPNGGIESASLVETLENFYYKSYIPLVKFSTKEEAKEETAKVLATVEQVLIRQTRWASNIVMGIKYMLSELVDNMHEHASSDYGYITAQCYPNLGFADICIGDIGITLLGSYKNAGIQSIVTDADALTAANKGMSTKNLPNAENRGYGLKSTRKIVVDGLGGQYFMLSGRSAFIDTPTGKGLASLPFDLNFKGTIIALRVPFNKQSFDLYSYVEI